MSIVASSELPETLQLVQAFLICPVCRSNLRYYEDKLRCQSCGVRYPVSDGIPELAVFEAVDSFAVKSPTGRSYQYKFVEDFKPSVYDNSFITNTRKHRRTKRELQILTTFLSSLCEITSLLNVPSGGGRLSQPLADHCSLLVEADIAVSQVRFARNNGVHAQAEHITWLSASAFHIPFSNNAFDGVVCARLAHHFDSPSDHERLFTELCRVANRFVIVSFSDRLSTKSISRKLRGKPDLFTLSREQIQAISSPLGFTLKDIQTVSPIGSRHRYALLLRN